MLVRTPLHLPADPLTAAAALAGEPGAFILFDAEKERTVLGCRPCARSSALDPEPGLPLDPDEGDFVRWVGVLPYEAFRYVERARFVPVESRPAPHVASPLWYRYGAVAVVEPSGAAVIGDDAAAVKDLVALLERGAATAAAPRASLELARPPEPSERHVARIEAALEHIRSGDLYQVNLARRFDFRARGHAIDLLRALGPRAMAPFAAALSFDDLSIVSGSPELFLDVTARGELTTRPIKGTRPRGASAPDDARLRLELDQSEKERAELAMVVDVERNDFGKISRAGSVQLSALPHVVTHPTVHHREASVVGSLRPGITREELLRVTMPSGSVTGAPKVRAMELIASLEAERRGLYTGALGTLAHDGSLRLSMAIRTLTIVGEEGHYFAGGGIVADSDPAAEVEETLWKARQLDGLAPELQR